MTTKLMDRQNEEHPVEGRPGGAALSLLRGAPLAESAAQGVLARYEEWVRRSPEAPAVIDGEHRWSYAQLDEAADAVAAALAGRVGAGDIVGVCLDRSAALVVTAIALARVGAVYLPLGPRPGERRIAAVAEDIGVACLIGAPENLTAYHPAAEQAELPVSGEGANAATRVVAAFTPVAPGARTAPAGSLYAVLTSGSTGRPKAVAVAEPALAALVDWYREETGLAPGDRQSLLIGVAFDPHLLELWAGLACGAALVPAPDDVRWDPAALTDWWRAAEVTACVAATPMIEPLLDRPWPQELKLRHLVVGGDRMRRRPGADVTATVHNAYGPAEATVATTTHAMRADDPDVDTDDAPPIGLPVAGASVAVTDADGAVVARGEDGELRIGGTCLALGYLDPELTARRFTAPPAELADLERMYRTGDRVRMLDDGRLVFLGRLDDQVKISGVRIEPAEVEAAFEQHEDVRSAVVTAPRDTDGRARLVAHVLPAPGATPAADDLLAGVRAWLPEQAVPSTVRIVAAFPLDANGKVDRTALLKEAEQAPGALPSDAAVPEDATADERLVLVTVRDLLGRPETTLDDNFAGAGGTSLLAARLLEALEKATQVRLRAPELLRQPDLRAIAAVLDKRRAAARTPGS
ncbi:amino acid adenylation domain-containing protein [Streptomyces sp. NBC_00083]|uniref:amino acid adenylation domain-containing protein n=1 Tax=Streptomyces sp. NBC_00083 TaxID=2975647 RepID=UPI00224D5E83|nr:amino acid adenylation domain-containing protein [Streptomyces sp. NBC_00083]MCX5384073.1 amino acid adenylation domain-containing protein [Streptomyces sp. NBC_00083]